MWRSLPSVVALLTCVSMLGSECQKNPHIAELEEAAEKLRMSIKSNPSNSTAYFFLGTVLQELNMRKPDGGRKVPEAEWAYRKGLEFQMLPEVRVMILGNLGALLMASAKLPEAVQAMDEAIDISEKENTPKASICGILFNRGKALSMVGDIKGSEEALILAIETSRFIDRSSYSKSLAALESVPDEILTELRCATSFLEGEEVDGTTCGKPTSYLWLESIEDSDKSWLYFSLWKTLNKRLPNVAWSYLDKANSLQSEPDWVYNRKTEEIGLKVLTSGLSKRVFQVPSGYRDATPIFIVGLPRSGSTLIEQLLASHSDVMAIGEDTPLAPLIGELMDGIGKPNVNQFQLLESTGKAYVQAVKRFVPDGSEPPKRIVDKMLRNAWNVGYIHLMLPDSCIIHAARHPLDAGLSCYAQPFEGRGTPWAWDLRDIGHQYRLIEELMRHWSRVLPNRVLKVHYEALVNDFEVEARRILNHCGLDWQDDVMKFHETKRSVLTASMNQVRKELYKTSIGKWKRYEEHLKPLQEELGGLVSEYEREVAHVFSSSSKAKEEL
ncbi:hypothetical protein BSKO_00071 [Bryopsis sp. KO-2023]|nr:hypothetical protein BSKO_00071 [Bryopsis sp. KO-2023]